jgi:predicted O-methyltransferase YrrM
MATLDPHLSLLDRHLRRLRTAARISIDTVVGAVHSGGKSTLRKNLTTRPLLFAEKTFNTAHPDYDPQLARFFPHYIHNVDQPSGNPLFLEIKKFAKGNRVPPRAWRQVRAEVMEEARTVPGFDQVMERKAFIENYIAGLERQYHAKYIAGWVNLIDAQFLYWAVRRAKPRTIVQAGVSNGLSSAFMMLALAKNGPEGRLYAIDLPHIFNPADPWWTTTGEVYGVLIPEGKSSGWMVPDIYRDRFDIEAGDAKLLLPALIDRLDRIDLFFHDSDHTYNHMMFEFEQAMRKLAPHGLIIADDVAWNASLRDFADKHDIPCYNYLKTIGVAFLS